MKLDIRPSRSGPPANVDPHTYVAPVFGGDEKAPLHPMLRERMRRPMLVGAVLIGVFVFGLGGWASFTSLATGVSAPAEVRVESNRKTMRSREGGTVRSILVREGQRVRPGQPLLTFSDVEAKAVFDVTQNQYDTLLAQSARFSAEATGRPTMTFPAELLARRSDPRVAGLIADQQFLFTTRQQFFQSQAAVLAQRRDQLDSQIGGLQAQVASIDEQRALTNDELGGYRILNEKGFAPRTLILRYERSLAELAGRKGALTAEIAKIRQQIGETRLQLASVRNEQQSQAAEGMRDTQSRLSDVAPRFTSAKQALASTVVRSPVDGYVFNLTQFTVGGVAGAGEVLMDVVPAGAPMIVTAMIRPEDVDRVHLGMDARVRLSGVNMRDSTDLPAKVVVISADRITNERTGLAFYRVDLKIDPKDLSLLKPGTELTPGMPAQALIVTGNRSVMGSLIAPITDTFRGAFREE